MLDLLLIFPPLSSKLSYGSYEQFKSIDIGNYPPLGLLYIGAYIKKYSNYEVKVLDAHCEKMNYNSLYYEIQNCQPKAVGIYTSSFTFYDSYEVAKIVKKVDKKIKVILGGPHIEIYPEESLSLKEVDIVVIGEGEIPVLEILDVFHNKKNFSDIQSIGCKVNGESFFTRPPSVDLDLDKKPFPDRTLTNYKKYFSFIGNNKIATTIMSSKGCPFRCNFCYTPYQGTVYFRSPENILSEIEACVRLGIKEFFFFDENFTLNNEIVLAICNGIISRKLDIEFYIRSRVDTLNEEIIGKLKEAGCKRIQLGVESGSPRILKLMNKGIIIDQIKYTAGLVKKYNIPLYADFMLGYPTETKEEIEQSIRFAIDIDPDYAQFGVTMLFPKTKIYENALKSGFLKEDFWRKVTLHPDPDITYPIASERYSKEELEKMQYKAHLRFYFRPAFLIKKLYKIKNLKELKRQAQAGLKLLLKG